MSSSSGAMKGVKKEDAAGKRTSTKPNAWSKPLQKSVTPPPGLSLSFKSSSAVPSNVDALRERFLHLLLNMVGQKVQMTLVDGAVYGGIFHTATPFPSLPADQRHKFVLKAVSIIQAPKELSTGVKAGQTLVVDMSQVVHLHLKSIRMDALTNNNNTNSNNNPNGTFQTDTEISGKNSGGNKGLVAAGSAWTTPIASPPSSGNGNSRADALLGNAPRPVQAGLQGSIGGWDQFKANEQLFNVKASYDENLYTTELDKSTIDQEKIEHAEKLAREIEGAASSNPHIAEERGHKIQGDYDEEDLYSGVLKEQPKKQPMNWAAVAKADKSQKQTISSAATTGDAPKIEVAPVLVPSTPKVEESSMAEATPVTSNRKKEQPDEEKVAEKKEAEVKSEKPSEEASKEEKPATSSETKEVGKSKLNANAKSFTFNINAKSFTPGSASVPPPESIPPSQPMPIVYDPNTGMPLAPHMYMHGPMTQPTMVHVMGHPQYPGMRYPYPGMDPQQMQAHMPGGMPPQGPPPPATVSSAPVNATASSESADDAKVPTSSEEQQQAETSQPQEGETSSVSEAAASSQQAQHSTDAQHQQQPPQAGVPMHYNVQYYGMYPQQQQRAFPPQFMHPMNRYPMVGPPMHTPYGYPPMAYPYGYEQGPPPMEDGFRGRGGRGGAGGARGGGRNAGRNGRGRGNGGRGQGGRFSPSFSNSGSGRNTPQGEGGGDGSKSPTAASQPNPSEGS
ncbi:hypothetical protein FisN_9Hh354 [Fistulifera solaris]|uniref:LsmAD domain-containing protein n=1 Tax=Fistulifera solaris TaxID=1519565 RepID=A0A1Z5KDA2_FISSO|nr:hypothetical protein FisN_9Hh354 [Fistulifera solaris]|eukprot:GAX24102.1 hypothetical protein FisN_9Hh354 [Fistulifera solaris]